VLALALVDVEEVPVFDVGLSDWLDEFEALMGAACAGGGEALAFGVREPPPEAPPPPPEPAR